MKKFFLILIVVFLCLLVVSCIRVPYAKIENSHQSNINHHARIARPIYNPVFSQAVQETNLDTLESPLLLDDALVESPPYESLRLEDVPESKITTCPPIPSKIISFLKYPLGIALLLLSFGVFLGTLEYFGFTFSIGCFFGLVGLWFLYLGTFWQIQ